MSYTHDRLEVEVAIGIVEFPFEGRTFLANIFTGESIEALQSVEGKTLRECLLNLRTKLDEMKVLYKDAYIYGEWSDDELTEDDLKAWGTRIQDL